MFKAFVRGCLSCLSRFLLRGFYPVLCFLLIGSCKFQGFFVMRLPITVQRFVKGSVSFFEGV